MTWVSSCCEASTDLDWRFCGRCGDHCEAVDSSVWEYDYYLETDFDEFSNYWGE